MCKVEHVPLFRGYQSWQPSCSRRQKRTPGQSPMPGTLSPTTSSRPQRFTKCTCVQSTWNLCIHVKRWNTKTCKGYQEVYHISRVSGSQDSGGGSSWGDCEASQSVRGDPTQGEESYRSAGEKKTAWIWEIGSELKFKLQIQIQIHNLDIIQVEKRHKQLQDWRSTEGKAKAKSYAATRDNEKCQVR